MKLVEMIQSDCIVAVKNFLSMPFYAAKVWPIYGEV